jgi:hypothetical protein
LNNKCERINIPEENTEDKERKELKSRRKYGM